MIARASTDCTTLIMHFVCPRMFDDIHQQFADGLKQQHRLFLGQGRLSVIVSNDSTTVNSRCIRSASHRNAMRQAELIEDGGD